MKYNNNFFNYKKKNYINKRNNYLKMYLKTLYIN